MSFAFRLGFYCREYIIYMAMFFVVMKTLTYDVVPKITRRVIFRAGFAGCARDPRALHRRSMKTLLLFCNRLTVNRLQNNSITNVTNNLVNH